MGGSKAQNHRRKKKFNYFFWLSTSKYRYHTITMEISRGWVCVFVMRQREDIVIRSMTMLSTLTEGLNV